MSNGHCHPSQGHRPWEILRLHIAVAKSPGVIPQAMMSIAFSEQDITLRVYVLV
ncbi:MAG: hypothetical protein ACKN82_14380 [Pirellula sp.]